MRKNKRCLDSLQNPPFLFLLSVIFSEKVNNNLRGEQIFLFWTYHKKTFKIIVYLLGCTRWAVCTMTREDKNSMKENKISQNFVLYGHVIHAPSPQKLVIRENSYLVCENGSVAGIFSDLPSSYASFPLYRYDHCLILPGLCDLHVHASQYAFRGTGMDKELIEWLNENTFLEEARYGDISYAAKAYAQFVDDLTYSATTRASIFATVHVDATLLLMQLLEKTGLCCMVGKVNMDRHSPDNLTDPSPEETVQMTEDWILYSLSNFKNTKPILTPRFIPSCSDGIMQKIAALQKKYLLPVQSHLSENRYEINWVKQLCPESSSYADAYQKRGMIDKSFSAVMAHFVYPEQEELDILKQNDVFVAHCPSSNANLSSGIAPISRYLDAGIRVGLGTDIGAGFDLSIFRAMVDAIQASKLLFAFTEGKERPITFTEAFYMGTKGSGAFFGNVGSFETGYAFDAIVIDDSRIKSPRTLCVQDRLERDVYLEKQLTILHKFSNGAEIFKR